MIRYANSKDYDQIRALWDICFPDDSGFNDYYFDHLFDLDQVLLLEIDHQIAAMTQMISRKVRLSDKEDVLCTYIYGACTHPAHRRKHLMSRLLERSFVLDRSLGRSCSILIPAESWLFDFYKRFGYEPIFKLNTEEITASNAQTEQLKPLMQDDISLINKFYEEELTKDYPYLARDSAEWRRQIDMFTSLGLGCFGKFAPTGELEGYAFAWKPEGETLYVQEVFAQNEQVKLAVLNAIASLGNVKRIRFSDNSASEMQFGCMKKYVDLKISNGYMNLMLN